MPNTAPGASTGTTSEFAASLAAGGAGGVALGQTVDTSSGVWGLPTTDMGLPVNLGNGVQSESIQQVLQGFYQMPVDQLDQLKQAMLAAGFYGNTLTGNKTPAGYDDASFAAYRTLVIDAVRSGQTPQMVLDTQLAAASSQVGKQVANPRTLGLGRYNINLTNPADVQAAANAMAQQLIGRDATPAEAASFVAAIHAQETAAGHAQFENYVSQELPYFENIHGGALDQTVTPGPTGLVGTPVAGGADTYGGGTTPGPMPPAPTTAGAAFGAAIPRPPGTAGPTLAANPPPQQQAPTVLPAGSPAPPGSITLADGTILVPPTQGQYTGAASPSAQAEAYYTKTPEYTAYNMVQAYQGLLNMVKQGGVQ